MPIDLNVSVQSREPAGGDQIGLGLFRTSKGFRANVSGIVDLDELYLSRRNFSGDFGDVLNLPALNGQAAVCIGLGEGTKLDYLSLRTLGAKLLRASHGENCAVYLDGIIPKRLDQKKAVASFVEGILLASYRFEKYKSKVNLDRNKGSNQVKNLCLVTSQVQSIKSGVERAKVISSCVAFARDLVNEPAGTMTPKNFESSAKEFLESSGVEIEIWDEKKIATERLGGVIGVSKGSNEPPRFITLRLNKGKAPVVLVGKGVTFDSGGLSLKSAGGMETMKTDMSGAAAVVGTLACLARLKHKGPVVGLIPLVENMPSGSATKPGDVLVARNGKTIEVLNTDAEGRLILADALSIACELEPAATIDLATLTGACVVALGDKIAGVMGDDTRLVDGLIKSAQRAGEDLWRLPLPDFYRKHIDSEIADIKNVGSPGGAGGSITAGLFLKEFAPPNHWAHLDIAGPARSTVDEGVLQKGATGFGVRTLVEFITSSGAFR